MPAIGIDLGTTYSCVSVVKNDNPEIIINNYGKRTTPSVIGLWNDKEIYVGKSVGALEHKYPQGVVKGVKYVIGKKDAEKSLINNNPMLIKDEHKLKYCIKRGNVKEFFLPEELSAMILKKLKEYAEDGLAEDVTKAVITVPTYFDDLQREATIAAGKIAGFKEIKLLNESISAAVAYGVLHKITNNNILFVFDFGGGTFDVSILKYNNNNFDVLAIDGDLCLGGDNITSILFDYAIEKLNDINIKNNKKTLSKLLQLCEDAKVSLSSQKEAFIDLCEQNDEIQISRDKFKDLTNDFFDKLMAIVKRCVERINIKVGDIKDIILVGGSSRIPEIQDRIEKYFNKKPMKNINPDESVALGAAIVAANWDKSGFEYLKLNTITAHSIGVEVNDGKDYDMKIIIPRYSNIPIIKSINFMTQINYSGALLKIYSGENKYVKNNTYLGELDVQNVTINPKTTRRNFDVTLEINEDGVLKVTTKDTSNKVDETTINLDKNNFKDIDIQKSINKLKTQQIK